MSRRAMLLGAGGASLSTGVFAQSGKCKSRTPRELNRLPNEPALEPDMPIVDPHHHLWFLNESVIAAVKSSKDPIAQALATVTERKARYLFEDCLNDIQESGHNVIASVYVEAGTMYRAHGPRAMKSVGEVEFANGVAAMAASESFSKHKICAGIVAAMPTTGADDAERVLSAYLQAGNDRIRGVRPSLP